MTRISNLASALVGAGIALIASGYLWMENTVLAQCADGVNGAESSCVTIAGASEHGGQYTMLIGGALLIVGAILGLATSRSAGDRDGKQASMAT